MRAQNKIVIILLVALVALSAVTVFAGSVKAAGTLNSPQVSISSAISGVSQTTLYTFKVTNAGPGNLGAASIAVPSSYKNVKNLVVTQEPSSQNWSINKVNNDIILVGSDSGLSPEQSVTFTFDATNPQVYGSYKWVIGVNENATTSGLSTPEATGTFSTSISITSMDAAIIIVSIAVVIAFINTVLNRVLINFFIGWEQYRVMQKEMNEYRSETMAAARANDKKQMEKLKKRQSQINAMQSKMLKPQMVQFAISFVYIFVWIFVLTPTYGSTSLVFLPGIGLLSNLLVSNLLVLPRLACITTNRDNAY